MNARAHSALMIFEVIYHKKSLNTVLKEKFPRDQPLIQELIYGSLRWFYQLQAIANLLLNKPLKSKDNDIYCFILIGLYQLIYMNIPDYAAVSETVSSIKSYKKPWATHLINKLLRRFIREKEALMKEASVQEQSHYSHPQWLIEEIQNAWPAHWQQILEANNSRSPLVLRINRLKISPKIFYTN